jgi:membrane-associated HD superfamily phosphohydrolase
MPHQENKEATEEEEDAEERDVHHALKVNKENADQENKEIDHLEEIIIIKKEVRYVNQEMIGHLEEIMKVKAEHHVRPEKIDHQENMFQGVKKVKAPLLEEVAAADVAVVAVEVTNVALVRTVTRKMANLRKLMLTVVSIDLRKID